MKFKTNIETMYGLLVLIIWLLGVYVTHWFVTIFMILLALLILFVKTIDIIAWFKNRKKNKNNLN